MIVVRKWGGELRVRTNSTLYSMSDMVHALLSYRDQAELKILLNKGMVRAYVKAGDKCFHPMGIITESLYNQVTKQSKL